MSPAGEFSSVAKSASGSSIGFTPYLQLCVLLAVALAVGGGGVGAGLANLAVQLTAIALLAWNGLSILAGLKSVPRPLAWLVMLTLAVPLVQLVPLPPFLWHSLPGRDLVRESLALVGKSGSWQPLSVAPARTVVSLLGLLPCLAVLLIALRVVGERAERGKALLDLIVVGGMAGVILGAVQLASGQTVGMLYAETYGEAELFGTFANRNSSGVFLVIALVALIGGTQFDRKRLLTPSLLARVALGGVLCVAIVLTRSRSSMGLTLIPLVFLAWRILPLLRDLKRSKGAGVIWASLAVIGFSVIGAGLALHGNDRLARSIARFDDLQTIRLSTWDDTSTAMKRYWPVGAGVGTFDEVFQVDESIEYLDATRAGRAHDEFLEQALESGVVGLLLAAAWCIWLAVTGWQVLLRNKDAAGAGGIVILCCIAFQSILDYPLRNQTLMCAAALAVAIICSGRENGRMGSTHRGVAQRG